MKSYEIITCTTCGQCTAFYAGTRRTQVDAARCKGWIHVWDVSSANTTYYCPQHAEDGLTQSLTKDEVQL